jgi:hypothetical protein
MAFLLSTSFDNLHLKPLTLDHTVKRYGHFDSRHLCAIILEIQRASVKHLNT